MQEPSKSQDTPEVVDASKISNIQEPSKPQDTPEVLGASNISNIREPSKSQDTPEVSDASKSPPEQHAAVTTDTTPVPSPMRALLVAVLVAAAIIGITWSFSGPGGEQASLDQSLKETRAKLTAAAGELKAAREAKASVDSALAETQARLAAEQEKRSMAEKAVAAEQEKRLVAEKVLADVRAVLANIPDASSNASSGPNGPTNEPSPK